jgi:hypothetical protein
MCAHSQNFHAAIVVIADPSSNPEDVGLAFHEPAKAHALHASAHHETAGLEGFFGGSHDASANRHP